MKQFILLSLLTFLFMEIDAQKLQKVKLETAEDSISYAFGISIAENLRSQDIGNIQPMALAKAFDDFYKEEAQMTSDEANQMIQKFFDAKEAENHKEAVEEGKTFLAENAKKAGVKTTASGLQYKVITAGTGATPTAADKVKVHYSGTLINGTKFDSSYDRGEPAEFGVTQVIKGWTEALQLMPVGSKWELYIPYDLAYGSRGAGGDIKPFSTLIFEVELLDIVK